MTVAALYVDPNGVYAGLDDVEVWDEERDARQYNGPWPVVAHPPCARWSTMAAQIETLYGHKRGEDGGCFAAALEAVRAYGGVLEQPAHSFAWQHFGLPTPSREGWTSTLFDDGWACRVDQGWYGHTLKKPTWLFAVGVELPALRWGHGPGRSWGRSGEMWNLSETERVRLTIPTPPAFRDVLLAMARSVGVASCA